MSPYQPIKGIADPALIRSRFMKGMGTGRGAALDS